MKELQQSHADDVIVFEKVKAGTSRFALNFVLGLEQECHRRVDRALQRLRKAGKIALVGKSWKVTS